MDIALERNFLSTFKPINSAERICELSTDIVVPDTKEDILRIVLTDGKYKIRSKDIEAGKIVIRGELEVIAAYVPETAAGLNMLRTDIPFECEFESEDIDNGCTAVAEIQLLSIETRILNPRKIMVNAQLMISEKCYCISEFAWYESPAEKGKNVFFKNDLAVTSLVNMVTEKTFSLEDEFQIKNSSESAEIITSTARFFADSADAVGSKLIVKGHAEIAVSYLNDGKIETADTTVNFSQIFELSERDTVPDYRVGFLLTGDFFEISDGRISFEIHAVMQMLCMEEKTINFISDAYACSARMQSDSSEIDIISAHHRSEQTESVQLTCTTDSEIMSIEKVTAVAGRVKATAGEATVPVSIDVVYYSADGQLRSSKVHSSVKIDIPAENSETIDRITAEISGARYSFNGKEISISAIVKFIISSTERKQLRMITAASYEACESSDSKPSLYMCSAADDDLWSLAKRYSSDVDMIAELNQLDESVGIKSRLLLIPRIK